MIRLLEVIQLDDYNSESGDDGTERSSQVPPPASPAQQQPDYLRAFALLSDPKSATHAEGLRLFLDILGVSEAQDLAELDEADLQEIFAHLKKVSLKKCNRFLCRGISTESTGLA